jgi:hypothetical protein
LIPLALALQNAATGTGTGTGVGGEQAIHACELKLGILRPIGTYMVPKPKKSQAITA